MAGKRQPLELVKGKGKKHFSKTELAEREAEEVRAPEVKQVRAPDFLPTNLRDKFNEISRQLVAMKIFAKLDRDTLARYLIAEEIYLRAVNHVQAALSECDSKEAAAWAAVQDKYFKQCRACANDLGLTITSRCRLVLPESGRKQEENPFEKMMRERNRLA